MRTFICLLCGVFSLFGAGSVQASEKLMRETVTELSDLGSVPFAALYEKMPEFYDGHTPQNERDLYRKLVSALPPNGQRWVLGMGQFIEDRKIDSYEKQLLEFLTTVKDPLVYLTCPRVMDGVDQDDLIWIKKWSPVAGSYCYLDLDLEQLIRARLVSSSIKSALKSLVSKAEKDFDLRKGLYLIANYGHAPKGLFKWHEGPSYNRQLFVLCQLLKSSIAEGEERLAVAAALDYGAVLTVTHRNNWLRIIRFAYQRLEFLRETTGLIREQGANWEPNSYSLEADIGLLWGGVCVTADPLRRGYYKPLDKFFKSKPMEMTDFNGNFASIKTLREMRDNFLKHGIFSKRRDFGRYLEKHPYLGGYYNKPIDIAAVFAQHQLAFRGRPYPKGCRRMDPNWQWGYIKKTGKIVGGCQEWGAVCCFYLRSLNIPALEEAHYNWYCDPRKNVWKCDVWELAAFQKQKPSHVRLPSFQKLPWHNFHLEQTDIVHEHPDGYFGVENIFALMNDKSMLKSGIPAGYVFRRGIRGHDIPW